MGAGTELSNANVHNQPAAWEYSGVLVLSKPARVATFFVALLVCSSAAPVLGADDADLARIALCKDSWFDWQKAAPDKLKTFGEHFRTEFSPHGNDAYFLPKKDVFVAGLKVAQAFPQSVGMGVGFSLTLDAPFDVTRKVMEKELGKPLGKCEDGDGMKSCELELAPQRNFMVMADDSPKATQTLVGCYYFYEK